MPDEKGKITEISGMKLRILKVLWNHYKKCREGEDFIPYLSYIRIAELMGIERIEGASIDQLLKEIWSFNTYYNELIDQGLIKQVQYQISDDIQNKLNRIFDYASGGDFLSEEERKIERIVYENPSFKEVSFPLAKLTQKGIDYCEKVFSI